MGEQKSLGRLRTRWAAIGAAIAVTLGAGTIATVNAVTSSGTRSAYTAIAPCRLVDTRPNSQVGPRNTPLGSDDTATIDARGAEGRCSAADLPDDAVALQLNVTAVGATLPTFLAITPDGSTDTSALNPQPGQPPTPNAVTVLLDSNGAFRIYNLQGNVDVVVDVTGFFTDVASAAPDVIDLSPADFFIDPSGTTTFPVTATFDDFAWLVGAGGGCLHTSLPVAEGRTVQSVTVFYVASTSIDLRAIVASRDLRASTNPTTLTRLHFDDVVTASGAVGEVKSITLTHDATLNPTFTQTALTSVPGTLAVCPNDAMSLIGARVQLASS